MSTTHRVASWIPWGCFVGVLALHGWFVVAASVPALPAVDFLTYELAAERLQASGTPYEPLAAVRQRWVAMHQRAVAVEAAAADDRGAAVLQAQAAAGALPGPYLYPPTLARLLAQVPVSSSAFVLACLLAYGGCVGLWLWATRAPSWWLWVLIGAVETTVGIQAGNAEVLLLAASLTAGWLWWFRHPLLAAPFISGVVLIKPFYALFFGVVASVWLLRPHGQRRTDGRQLLGAAGASLLLCGWEIALWGRPLQRAAWQALRESFAQTHLVLPRAEQTPMSTWNRTLPQALVTAGLPPAVAQLLSLGVGLALLALALRVLWRQRSQATFAMAIACALVLTYLVRPLGWSFLLLDLVVGVVIWPGLGPRGRTLVLAGVIGLTLSHWVAFAMTVMGRSMAMLTLQSATVPWETALLFVAWGLLIRHGRRPPPGAPAPHAAPA